MTVNVTKNGLTRTYTDVELVEEAFRALEFDPADLGEGWIAYWLKEGKSLVDILAIAGFTEAEWNDAKEACALAIEKNHDVPKREKGAAA